MVQTIISFSFEWQASRCVRNTVLLQILFIKCSIFVLQACMARAVGAALDNEPGVVPLAFHSISLF